MREGAQQHLSTTDCTMGTFSEDSSSSRADTAEQRRTRAPHGQSCWVAMARASHLPFTSAHTRGNHTSLLTLPTPPIAQFTSASLHPASFPFCCCSSDERCSDELRAARGLWTGADGGRGHGRALLPRGHGRVQRAQADLHQSLHGQALPRHQTGAGGQRHLAHPHSPPPPPTPATPSPSLSSPLQLPAPHPPSPLSSLLLPLPRWATQTTAEVASATS